MIIDKNIHPEHDLYFLGAKLIEIMDSLDKVEWEFFDLFVEFYTNYKVSINLFLLVLDWLFILGVIRKTTNGVIVKCF
jgi:hypothetical protein